MFPLSVLMFILADLSGVIYFRLLSQYDLMKKGIGGTIFEGMKNYWLGIGLLLLTYFLLIVAKYFTLNAVILNSNE